MTSKSLLVYLVAAVATAGCTKLSEKQQSASRRSGATDPSSSSSCSAATPPTPTAGQLSFQLQPTTVDPCSVKVQIVGDQSVTSTVHVVDGGTVYVDGLPDGTKDAIVTGQIAVQTSLAGGLRLDAGTTLGVRLSGVTLTSGAATNLSTVELFPLSTLAGVAKLSGATDHTGIDVYIPGTQYEAHTDQTGAWQITGVPKGTQNLQLEKEHYTPGQVGQIVVDAGATVKAPDVTLYPATGESNPLRVIPAGTAAEPLTSLTATYVVTPTGHPVSMRIGEDPNFPNQALVPFVSTGTFTFAVDDKLKSGGKASRKLYVQLIENGAPSVLEADVTIDLFHGMAFTLESPVVSGHDAPSFTISGLTVPDGADKMDLSINADFSGAKTVTAASSATYTFPDDGSGCGTHTLYVRMHLPNGVVSPAVSQPIEYRCYHAMSTTNAPSDRAESPVVLAGTKMIVWGGRTDGSTPLATGAVYDVDADTWTTVATTGAPVARYGHTAVWSGSKLMVWGGVGADGNKRKDGALYDPATNTWVAMTAAPSGLAARKDAYGAWTGSKFLVYGGTDDNSDVMSDGALYDPVAQTWQMLASTASNAPTLYEGSILLWAGGKLLVWGGQDPNNWSLDYNTGSILDPSGTPAWTAVASSGAPTARANPFAVWTGTEIAVFGGYDDANSVELATGAFFNPATNAWRPMTSMSLARSNDPYQTATAGLVGGKVFAWGGNTTDSNDSWTGALLSPGAGTNGTWSPLTSTTPAGAPPDDSGGHWQGAVVGSRYLMWTVSSDPTKDLQTSQWAKLFDPATSTWSALPNGGPSTARAQGGGEVRLVPVGDDRLIAWGGDDGSSFYQWHNDGTVYYFRN